MGVDEIRQVVLNPFTGLPLTKKAMYRHFRRESGEGPPLLKQLIAERYMSHLREGWEYAVRLGLKNRYGWSTEGAPPPPSVLGIVHDAEQEGGIAAGHRCNTAARTAARRSAEDRGATAPAADRVRRVRTAKKRVPAAGSEGVDEIARWQYCSSLLSNVAGRNLNSGLKYQCPATDAPVWSRQCHPSPTPDAALGPRR
jgi:hypothetical protein